MMVAAGVLLAAFGALYATLAFGLLLAWRAAPPPVSPRWRPALSVLKPLCGAEPGLRECLRSFFVADYPELQLVFGVRDATDPALAVVSALRREFPARDVAIVVDDRVHGENPKASNLINMLPQARHPVLLVSDSDVRIGARDLDAIVGALEPDGVGAVTCLYRARAGAGIWSRIAALFVNDWYFPAVLVSHALGDRAFASGVAIALRAATLRAIGGLQVIADHLADDWLLCRRVRDAGMRTVLCRVVVETRIGEAGMAVHAARELRWMRTIRTIAPIGYAFMGLSMTVPVALLGTTLAWAASSGTATRPVVASALLLAWTLLLRLAVHVVQRRRMGAPLRYDLPLIPLRDALLLAAWIAGFLGRGVDWRGRRYRVRADGSLTPRADPRRGAADA